MEDTEVLQKLGTTVGVALAISLFLIFVSGFFARSNRDLALVLFGFATGLFAAYLTDTSGDVVRAARKTERIPVRPPQTPVR